MTDKRPPLKHIKQSFFRCNMEKRVVGPDSFKHLRDIWFSLSRKTQALLCSVPPLTSHAAVVWSWYWSEVWDNIKDDLSFASSSFLNKFKISESSRTSLSNFLVILKRISSESFSVDKGINKKPYYQVLNRRVATLIKFWIFFNPDEAY